MSRTFTVAIALLVVVGCEQRQLGDAEFAEGVVQHVVHAGEAPWGPCPPTLPAGCEIAVLEGNPQEPDLFTVRFRLDAGLVMPPHTHPKDERVTVLEGSVAVAFDSDAGVTTRSCSAPATTT